ncbi:MAG: 50S ribosomal protein L4 [bacterium]
MATNNTKNKNKLNAKKVAPKKAVVPAAPAKVLEATVYDMKGKSAGTITLPAEIFGKPWRPAMVHQVALAMEANARPVVANTKGRGEVRGGGRKPWKQKGTGRARHGSSRSPIWRGGGITFGPTSERSYKEKINRKLRVAALFSVLSKKAKDGEVLFVDKFTMGAPKTAVAKAALVAIGSAAGADRLTTKARNSAVIALGSKNLMIEKSFRNIGNLVVEEVRNLNPVTLLKYRYLIIEQPAEAFKTLTARSAK